MPQISRETLYGFESQAAAYDRMPAYRATNGQYFSHLLGPTAKGTVYWYTNDRGDLFLERCNAISVLQGLQRWARALPVDRYYGSQTRTRLLQETGLADGPRNVVEMRELLEKALLMARHDGRGAVIFPQRTRFPALTAISYVDGPIIGQGSCDRLLYWDGSRGTFTGREPVAPVPVAALPEPVAPAPPPAPPPVPAPPVPVAPPPPAAPPHGRVIISLRAINLPPEGSSWGTFTDAPPVVLLVDQAQTPTSFTVTYDAPGGTRAPFVFAARRPDGSAMPPSSVPMVFVGDKTRLIGLLFDAATGATTVESDILDGAPVAPVALPVAPVATQQASFIGNPLVWLGVAAVVGTGIWLRDRTLPPSKRLMRPA